MLVQCKKLAGRLLTGPNTACYQDEAALCTLGAGTTFGASVTPGRRHGVSVVTSDECTLLRVRRADFQEIFADQAHLLGSGEPAALATALAALKRDRSSVTAAAAASPSRQRLEGATGSEVERRRAHSCEPGSAVQDQDRGEQEEEEEDADEDAEEQEEELEDKDSELAKLSRAARVLRTLLLASHPPLLQNRRLQPHHLLHSTTSISGAAAAAGTHGSRRAAPRSRQLSGGGGGPPVGVAGGGGRASAGRKVASYVASSLASMGRASISGGGASQRQSSAVTLSYSANSAAPPNLAKSPTHAAGPNRHLVGPSNSFDAPLGRGPQDATTQPVLFRRCLVGRELVDWLLELTSCEPPATGSSDHHSHSQNHSQRASTCSTVSGSSRLQALSMWQVLLERGLLVALTAESEANNKCCCCCQFLFRDHPCAYYRFRLDAAAAASAPTPEAAGEQVPRPSQAETQLARASLRWALRSLGRLAPDACLRLILAKEPRERSADEVDMVFEELQHLKALSHLTVSVKRQLAGCVSGEHQPKQNTVVFNQGDPGHSWYIILRGSVLVVIVGKGVVCSLHEGDDFGKLALVNDAPRAATIVTNAPDCYFLRVHKHDFNTILRDLEANTVRLKEHGKEVLILQRVPPAPSELAAAAAAASEQVAAAQVSPAQEAAEAEEPPAAASTATTTAAAATTGGAAPQAAQAPTANQAALSNALKYMVMAGTGEKMLEHLLETRIDGQAPTAPPLTGSGGQLEHDQVAAQIPRSHDNFLEDFILTHTIFMPTGALCLELLKHYQCQQPRGPAAAASSNPKPASLVQPAANPSETRLDDEYLVAKKRRVVKFVRAWMLIARQHFFHQHQIQSFLTSLHRGLKQDAARHATLQAELKVAARMLELHLEEELGARHRGCQRWIEDQYGSILPIRRHCGPWEPSGGDLFLSQLQMRRFELKPSSIQSRDELVIRVYAPDHSHASLRARLDEKVAEIKQLAARRLKIADKELILVHVRSNGERIIYNDLDFITATLTVNGRIFVCPLDHIDALSPLASQDPFQAAALPGCAEATSGASQSTAASQQQQPFGAAAAATTVGLSSHLLDSTPTSTADIRAQMSLSASKLEEFSSRDIAYCLSQLAWALLRNTHESELIFLVFGRHHFKLPTANLNVFLRHFNEIQFWVITEICLSSSLSKRVQMLRKFIKIAAHCKELQNLNAFFAIIMGLSNMAVARLTQTWERLPGKLKRTYSQFEALIDPSRNHHRYRLFISRMEPPIIPFMPLFLKDVTFAHEGNKTHLESGLINFEKMQMVAQSLRTIRYCKSRPMKLDPSACKYKGSIRAIELFLRDLKIIDNQRTLTQMSQRLEHRKA